MQEAVNEFLPDKKESILSYDNLETLSLSFLVCALVLPLKGMSAGLYIFIALNIFKHFKYKSESINELGNYRKHILILFCLFYVAHIPGLLWSAELPRGYRELETKIYLVVIPLSFYLFKVTAKNIHIVFYRYIYAVTLAIIVCFGIAFYWAFYYGDFQTWPFKYYNFTYRIDFHPSYFALVVLISVLCIVYLIRIRYGGRALYFILFFHVFTVIFIGSRFGIIALVLIFVLIGFQFASRIIKRKFTLAFIVAFLFLGVAGYILSKNTATRLLETHEATGNRIELFKVATELIKKRPWVGYGAGSDILILLEEYKRKGLTEAFEAKYNTHNQFLQSWLTLGVFGFILLVFLIFKLFRNSRELWCGVYILLVFIFFFLIEAVLERHRGVVSFAAWALLCSFYQPKLKNPDAVD